MGVCDYTKSAYKMVAGTFSLVKATAHGVSGLIEALNRKGTKREKTFLSVLHGAKGLSDDNPTFDSLLSAVGNYSEAVDSALKQIGLDGAFMRDHKGRNALHLLFLPLYTDETPFPERIVAHIATILVQLNSYGCDTFQGDNFNLTPRNMWKHIKREYEQFRDGDLSKTTANGAYHEADERYYDQLNK